MPRKTTGLGWANRAVSKKSNIGLSDEKLVRLADDLAASIELADWDYCARVKHKTLHMLLAVQTYRDWKRENNV